MPKKDTFIYCASAVAVGANFKGSNGLTQSWASCALPTIGGKATSEDKGPEDNPVLSFGTAKTEITGEHAGGQRVTTIETLVTNLKICGKLTADEIKLKLVLTFNDATRALASVDVTSSPYTNLLINGVDYSTVTLDVPLANTAGKNHKKFCSENPSERRNKSHMNWHGKVHSTLVEGGPALSLDPDQCEYAFVDMPGCGRVYFAEWSAAEDWQSITALRIVLEPSNAGEIVIADPIGNGEYYP